MDKYDFVLDLEADTSLRWINECLTDNSVILEFGPAHGRLSRYLKEERNCIIDIVEIDAEAGKDASMFARTAMLGSVEGNIENYVWLERLNSNRYDYIIFADVLEHLYNPILVLQKCKQLLADNGKIVFSVPNIAYNGLILNLLRDYFEYTPVGLLDDTHIRFFTFKSILDIVNKLGMYIVYQNATQSQIGNNEVTGRYEHFLNFDTEIIKSHPLGEVYQFIIAMQNKPGEMIDKLTPIVENVKEKYIDYVKPEKVIEEKEKVITEKEKVITEKEKVITELLNSKSWKITAPLRYISKRWNKTWKGN